MNKGIYETMNMEVAEFDAKDIIVTSGPDGEDHETPIIPD